MVVILCIYLYKQRLLVSRAIFHFILFYFFFFHLFVRTNVHAIHPVLDESVWAHVGICTLTSHLRLLWNLGSWLYIYWGGNHFFFPLTILSGLLVIHTHTHYGAVGRWFGRRGKTRNTWPIQGGIRTVTIYNALY